MNYKDLPSYHLLMARNIPFKVIMLGREPRSAADIAELFGCHLSQVIKTLFFVNNKQEYALVSVPGDARVDMKFLALALNWEGEIQLAKREETQKLINCQFGGVTPLMAFTKNTAITMILDHKVLSMPTINIGSGEPSIGYELASSDLMQLWQGEIRPVTQVPTITRKLK